MKDPLRERSGRGRGSNWALSSIGIEVLVDVVLGAALGYWLDRRFGTEPWLLIAGLLFGIAAGYWTLFKLLRRREGSGNGDGESRDRNEGEP